MEIFYHPQFRHSYQKLFLPIKSKAEIKERIFRKNPFDQQLKTHKLHGKLRKLWSFSVDAKHRIVFEFNGSDVVFLEIGDHEIYQ